MTKYYYDEYADTLYVSEDTSDSSGYGWLVFFILLALPFFIIGTCVWHVANFVFARPVLSAFIYIIATIILSSIFYSRKKIKHKLLGIVAVAVSLFSVAIIQVFYALPQMLELSTDLAGLSNIFGWMIITFFSVGTCVFLNLICGLLKNGIKHLVASSIYFAITVSLLFIL